MKTRIVPLLSALAFLSISCENNPDEGSVWDDPKFVRLVAPTEMVASGNTEQEIFYKEGQLIKVWDQSGNAVDLKINKDKDSVFFSYEWIPDAVPAYAAFPAAEDAVCSADGVFDINVAAVQTVSNPGEIANFYAVGRVTGANRTSYKVNPMRNVTGFMALNLGFPLIESIKIESVAGEPLAGKITVDWAKLDNAQADYMTLSDEVQSSITLTPAEEGTTLKAGMYYVALLPGIYSQGLRLTVDYKVGDTVEKTYFTDGVTIGRSDLDPLGSGYADDDLPDDVRVDLTFSEGWPFVETIVAMADQEAASFAGDTYAYMLKYQAGDVEKEKGLSFFIKGNNQAYEYAQNVFKPGARNSRITLPALPGRYIRAVRMETSNSVMYPKGFKLTNMSWKDLATCGEKSYAGSPATLSFPTESKAASELEAPYYMYFIDGSPSVTTISILYSRELPSSYDDNPFGDETVEPEPPVVDETLPDEITLTLDFATGWPFKEQCADITSQTDEGEPYTYVYEYEQEGSAKTKDLSFTIMRSDRGTDKKYVYSIGEEPHALVFYTKDSNCTAKINFPVIPDRYVKEIRAVHNNPGTEETWPRFNITQNFMTNITLARIAPGEETVLTLPHTATIGGQVKTITSELNQTYSLRMRDKDMKVTKVTITYSKTKPE